MIRQQMRNIMNNKNPLNIPAYILAGGDSKRFGENKALFEFEGKSLIERMLELIRPLVSSVNIITKNDSGYQHLDVNILVDDHAIQTPLAGILRGLEDTAGWGLFLACDLPNMNSDIISRLLNSLNDNYENEGIKAVVAATSDDELQPLVACYHKSEMESLEYSIKKNQSMKKWLSKLNIKRLNFEQAEPFLNINRKEDLSKL